MSVTNMEQGNNVDGETNKKTTQYLAAFLATVSAMSVGTCLAWTSPTKPLMEDQLHILNESQTAWVGSLLTVGAFIGALPAGYLVNNLGRKRTAILIHIPLIISWIIICISVSYGTSSAATGLYFARFLGGLAAGILSVAGPMYVLEIAENSIRGTLGTFYQLQVTIGILYAYVVGLFNDVILISVLCGVIPFVFIGTFMWMPESPVYLISKNKIEEARKSLQWLRGDDYQIEPEINRMEQALEESKKNEAGLTDIFSDKVILKALFIVLGLMVFQQLSGVNAVIFYTSSIFKSAGSSLPPEYASIIIGVVQVIATYCSSLLIDKAGRRILLLISDSIMAICLALLGLYFHLQEKNCDVSSWSWLPLVCLALFIVVFSLGFGPIPWIIMGELVPNNLKGISSALAACINWLLAFNVTNTFSDLVLTYGQSTTFFGFSVICVIGTIFVSILLPETKGKDIDAILEELGRKPSDIKLENSKPQC